MHMSEQPVTQESLIDTQELNGVNPYRYADLSRRDVRAVIFHLLYAAESHEYDTSLNALIESFNHGFDLDIPLDSEAAKIAQAVIEHRDMLDDVYKSLLANWRFDRISVCTKLILRLAIWELRTTATDHRIIINEAIELAKCFAERDAYRFINGILDRVVKLDAPASQDHTQEHSL